MHGPLTDHEALKDMMAKLLRHEEARAAVINYKKSGEAFLNMLTVCICMCVCLCVCKWLLLRHEEARAAFINYKEWRSVS